MRTLSTALIVASCLAPTMAAASTVRFLSDAELIALSDRVVHGRVVARSATRGPDGLSIYTITTLSVIEDLTGVESDTVEVWELGGTLGDETMRVGGGVEYELGAEVVACLRQGPLGLHGVGMALSKFDVRPATAGAAQLARSLDDVLVIGAPANPVRRSLQEFRQLVQQVTGRSPRAGLRPDAAASSDPPPDAFSYRGARWVGADSGVPIRYYVNTNAASPLAPASPTTAVQTALAAWTDPPSASVILQYAGTTFQAASNGPWSGIPANSVVISFEDPDNQVDDPVLALAYSFTSVGTGGTVHGTRFDGYLRASIKFQNIANLPATYRQAPDFTRVLTHEVGHTIGLLHTQPDGTVANPTANIMYSSCCYTASPTPPAIGPDDLAGLVFLYPVGLACTFAVTPTSASYPFAGGSGNIVLTTYADCPWTATSSAGFVAMTSVTSGSGPAVLFYTVAANTGPQRTATITVAGQSVTITQAAYAPAMALDRSSLGFTAVTGGGTFVAQTAAQSVALTQSGPGTVTWTAAPTQPWLRVSPTSGVGPATLVVSIVPSSVLPASGTRSASVQLSYSGATPNSGAIAVSLTLTPIGMSLAPFGLIDTPLDNATGVTGAFAFTGWALDDVEVTAVVVCRAAVAGEAAPADGRCGGAAQIRVADATFIEGARPDIQAAYPSYPRNRQAGWGVMVLTNMLPDQGNGTYRFFAYAHDREGRTALLGTRTMSCDNRNADRPFGTIDTPGQGEVVSGSAYVNFGWALTQVPKAIPTDGSTITVYVDSVPIGQPSYGHYRADVSTLFPGLSNSDGAVGFLILDTTTLSNGLHTIAWTVTDSAGFAEGLGSRFFIVANGSAARADTGAELAGATALRRQPQ